VTAPAQAEGPIVFIGDSITYWWNQPLYVPKDQWLCQLVPACIDAGIGGQTSVQMLARFQSDVLAEHPKTVVIEAGTNDLLYAADPTLFEPSEQEMPTPYASTDSIAQMAEFAAQAGIRVIIASVPITSAPQYDLNAATVTAFNVELQALCVAHGYTYLDYQGLLQVRNGEQDEALFLPDAIHPNAAGYARMWILLSRVLGLAQPPPPYRPII
jgi:lysophospholipase L1-like esterase